MNAVRYRFRAELRARWKSVVALALLAGMAGAVALAAVAGARRTDSAFARMLRETRAADLLVNPDFGNESGLDVRKVAALPMVADAGKEQGVIVQALPVHPTDIDESLGLALTGSMGYSFARPHVLHGRMPRADRAHEVLVNPRFADAHALHAGDDFTAVILSQRDFQTFEEEGITLEETIARLNRGDAGTRVRLRVAGIGVSPEDVVVDEGFEQRTLVATPAFFRHYPQSDAGFFGVAVRLRHGTRDLAAFKRAVQALPHKGALEFQTNVATSAKVDRAVRPSVGALTVFAIVIALTALLVVGQAIARQTFLDSIDHSSLRALGFQRAQLVNTSMLRGLLVAALAAIVAVIGALALSPLMPIGPARTAEPDRGLSVDGAVIGLGALAVVGAILVLSAASAWWYARATAVVNESGTGRPSRVSAWLRSSGSPVVPATGVRMALEPGRGRTAVPVRSTVAGAALAIASVVAAVTFAASLDHLVSTPRLYGWSWDASIDTGGQDASDAAALVKTVDQRLQRSPLVRAYTTSRISRIDVDGVTVTALGVHNERRRVGPTIVAGRAPRSNDEIALGAKTLDRIGASVGDRVRVKPDAGGAPVPLRVVGRVVLPGLGTYPGSDKTALGEGALLTRAALKDLGPDFGAGPFLVTLAPSATRAQLARAIVPKGRLTDINVSGLERPSDIVSYERVRTTPLVLAGVLALLAIATVAHALVTAVRRRRRDLALLKTLGFTRRQVSASVAWQATTFGVFALLIGVPVGIVIGRWAWTALADNLGTVAEPVVPVVAVLLAIPLVLLVANAVAYAPGPIRGPRPARHRVAERVMNAIRMLGRATLRHRWWGTVAVALLIAVAGAAVLAALAGARRTETAYPRLLATEHVGDVSVAPQGIGVVPVGAIRDLPHVKWAEARKFFILASRAPDGKIVFGRDLGAATVAASPRAHELYRVDQAQVLEGRLPDPTRVDEGAVNEIFAEHSGLGVGDTYHAWVYDLSDVLPVAEQAQAAGREPTDAELRPLMTPIDFRITGIGRSNTELVVNENQSNDTIFATPAFVRRYGAKSFVTGVSVKLDDPVRDTSGFERAVRRRFPELSLDIQATATGTSEFARVVGPYGDALRIFAFVAALTAIFVIGQALARQIAADARDLPTLYALGATRRQRVLVCANRSMVAVLVGAVLAFVGAFALSPLFPLGRARDAEPATGLRFDGAVLLLGTAITVAVLLGVTLGIATVRARRATTAGAGPAFAPSRIVGSLARRGAPVAALTGVGFAVQRDRRAPGTSLAATLVGVVAAITATAAALTFAVNLDDLVSSPSRYGWTWGLVVASYSQQITPDLADRLRADGDLTAVTLGTRASAVVAGRAVPVYGFRRMRGNVAFGLPEGRMPRGGHEVALGAQTMRDLGVGIGDRFDVPTAGGRPLRVRVVGQVLLPSLTNASTFGVAEGMAFDEPAMQRLDPSAEPAFALVDVESGVATQQIAQRYGREANVYGPNRPGDVAAYSHVRSTPLALAGLLAVLAAGVLAHVMVTAIRSRRRDLAVLKTLGFTRRQVAGSVAWQATTVAVLALLVGIPVGIGLGRWTWRSFANDLGIDETMLVPVAGVTLLAAGALLLANLVAALPARFAARTHPATVLRSE